MLITIINYQVVHQIIVTAVATDPELRNNSSAAMQQATKCCIEIQWERSPRIIDALISTYSIELNIIVTRWITRQMAANINSYSRKCQLKYLSFPPLCLYGDHRCGLVRPAVSTTQWITKSCTKPPIGQNISIRFTICRDRQLLRSVEAGLTTRISHVPAN